MKNEWFRKTSWAEEDAADFERRLRRARPSSRAQYLYLQAQHLLQAGDAINAVSLADRAASDPFVGVHVAAVHNVRAASYCKLGDLQRAKDAYRAAVRAETAGRVIGTEAYLDLSWLIATERERAEYTEVLELLDAFADRGVFPVQRFRRHAVRALIAFDQGDANVARSEAVLALQAASAETSGFRYHERLGLVRGFDHDALMARLKKIRGVA